MRKIPLRIGTRGSPLALAQTEEVRVRLLAACPDLGRDPGGVEIVTIKTSGDRILDRTLAAIGGKGLFTREIDAALLSGEIDIAVHSMKDVPTVLPDGLILPCILEREDPRDALISPRFASLAALPSGSVIGTASLRRGAQILFHHPDLRIVPLRGNVQTRLSKVATGEVDATILAVAGLRRLGWQDRITTALDPQEMLPAVAQGAIGVTCRSRDADVQGILAPLDHAESHLRVLAERAFLDCLDGSCRTPIGGLAEIVNGSMRFHGMVITPDGSVAYETSREGPFSKAEEIGHAAGKDLLARCGSHFLDFQLPANQG